MPELLHKIGTRYYSTETLERVPRVDKKSEERDRERSQKERKRKAKNKKEDVLKNGRLDTHA